MIRIAIVDDDQSARENLVSHIERYEQTHNSKFKITNFSSGIDFISDYTGNFDVILMDVDMPHINGFATSKKLREVDKNVKLIFVTNLSKYAIRGYEVNAINYLIKPVLYETLERVLDNVLKSVESEKNRFFFVTQKNCSMRVFLKDIYYISTSGRYVVLHTVTGEVEMHVSMKEVEKMLVGESFVRIDNSSMVNLEYVMEVNKDGAVVNGELIPYSRNRKKALMDAFTLYFR